MTKQRFTCYMCDRVATTDEHVPPRCLFPEQKDLPSGVDLRKALIKVPSCELHNCNKTKDDEYLMIILSTTWQGNAAKQRHYSTKVRRALSKNPGGLYALFDGLTPYTLIGSDGRHVQTGGYQVDLRRFNRIMGSIAHGLFFNHMNRRYDGPVLIYTDAFPVMTGNGGEELNRGLHQGLAVVRAALAGTPTHGENTEVFHYRFGHLGSGQYAVDMTFYEGLSVAAHLRSRPSDLATSSGGALPSP